MTNISSSSRRVWSLACLLALGAGCADWGNDDAAEAPADEAVVAAERPSFEEFKAAQHYEASLDKYVVEYDMVMDEGELRAHYDKNVGESGALSVFVNAQGVDRVWSASEKHDLTYCISDAFGSKKGRVLEAMRNATESWENVLDVEFRYVPSADGNCTWTSGTTRVPVTFEPNAAAEFYAGSNARSGIIINLGRFDAKKAEPNIPLTLAGVLRHELGHSLGFPHEHERVGQSNPKCRIDGGYRTLTGIDFNSVMYYPYYIHTECTGRNERTDLFLSARDAEGGMKIYGAQSDLVIAGNTIYMRKRSTGDFFRWAGSSFQLVGGPGRQFVGVDTGVWASSPDGKFVNFLPNNSTNWSVNSMTHQQLFQCGASTICMTDNLAQVWKLSGGTWSKIGNAGKKFVWSEALYAQSPDSLNVYKYLGSGMDWSGFAAGPWNDILPAPSGVFAIEPQSSGIVRLLTNGLIQIVGGPGAQFYGKSPAGLVALTPAKDAVNEFISSSATWRNIGGPAKRVARTSAGTVVALSPTGDLCMAPNAITWSCVGQP